MLSHRLCARLGLFAALALMLGTMTILYRGSRPTISATAAAPAALAPAVEATPVLTMASHGR